MLYVCEYVYRYDMYIHTQDDPSKIMRKIVIYYKTPKPTT